MSGDRCPPLISTIIAAITCVVYRLIGYVVVLLLLCVRVCVVCVAWLYVVACHLLVVDGGLALLLAAGGVACLIACWFG